MLLFQIQIDPSYQGHGQAPPSLISPYMMPTAQMQATVTSQQQPQQLQQQQHQQQPATVSTNNFSAVNHNVIINDTVNQ